MRLTRLSKGRRDKSVFHAPRSFTISESLGRGQEMTDWEFICFTEGHKHELTPKQQRRLADLFGRDPWHQELMRIGALKRQASQGTFSASAGHNISHVDLEDMPPRTTSRYGIKKSPTFAKQLILASAFTVALILIFPLFGERSGMTTDPGKLITTAQSSMPPIGASRGVQLDGITLVYPNGGVVSTLRPTFRWKARSDIAVTRIVVLHGNQIVAKHDLPIATTWKSETGLTPNTFYSWQLVLKSGSSFKTIESEPFYVLDRTAVDFASGKRLSLTPLQEAVVLIELRRWQEAAPILKSESASPHLSQSQRTEILQLVRECDRRSGT